jgi:hypothetical protein
MKAQEYAKQFMEGRVTHRDPVIVLKLIFQQMIREANIRMRREKCKSPAEVAKIFDEQSNKWQDMCVYLIKYPINKMGFLSWLKSLQPNVYFALVANGLTPLPEDKILEIIAEGIKDDSGKN